MILIAVIVGYILGTAPFVVPKILEIVQNKRNEQESQEDEKKELEIFDEWLNGPKQEKNLKNQEDIYQEYISGQEVVKGD